MRLNEFQALVLRDDTNRPMGMIETTVSLYIEEQVASLMFMAARLAQSAGSDLDTICSEALVTRAQQRVEAPTVPETTSAEHAI